MSEKMVWHDTWLLGIKALDKDHREIIRLINLIPYSGGPPEIWRSYLKEKKEEKTESREILLKRLDDLISHLRNHFKKEDAFLRSIDYPGHHHHANENSMELAALRDMRRDLADSGAYALDKKGMMLIKNWFFNHVMVKDKAYADFYRKHRKPSDW